MVFTIEYSNDTCLNVQVRHVGCPGSRYQIHRWFAYALGDEIALTIAYINVKLFTRTCFRVRISLKITNPWPISPTRSLRLLVSEELYSYGEVSLQWLWPTWIHVASNCFRGRERHFPLCCVACVYKTVMALYGSGASLDGFQYYSIETNYSISAKTQN